MPILRKVTTPSPTPANETQLARAQRLAQEAQDAENAAMLEAQRAQSIVEDVAQRLTEARTSLAGESAEQAMAASANLHELRSQHESSVTAQRALEARYRTAADRAASARVEVDRLRSHAHHLRMLEPRHRQSIEQARHTAQRAQETAEATKGSLEAAERALAGLEAELVAIDGAGFRRTAEPQRMAS